MDLQSMMETFAEAWVAANTPTPFTEAAGRTSIPIRCVVERVMSGQTGGGGTPDLTAMTVTSSATSGGTSSANSAMTATTATTGTATSSTVTSSPTSSVSPPSNSCSSAVTEQDTYAIIASNVLFCDLVRTALLRLGFSASEIVGAKGVVQLKNWKPLTFDQITDNGDATVGDILGDIASFVTLRIRLFRPRMNAAHELKDKLLQVLLAHSYSLLVNSGCPIDQQMLSGRAEQEITDDVRRRFDQWYLQQVFNHYRQIAIATQQQQQQQHPQQQQQQQHRRTPTHPLLVDLNYSNGESCVPCVGNGSNHSSHSPEEHAAIITMSSPPNNQHNITSVRTRIRTSFDPELELPKLHRWFAENRHPSRAQVQEYVKELNSLESRKGRKPLDINNVVYWFKNARAAHKRAELKYIGDTNVGTNDVNGSHSPGKTGSDTSGKCNEETRNGSAIDDYYSLDDEDGESSRDATQTLDLSMRPPKKSRSESPASVNSIKHEYDVHSDDNIHSNNKNNNTIMPTIKHEPTDRNDGSSDCNSLDDSDDDKEYFDHINTFQQINNNISNNNSSLPESPDGRRIRRSRTFIDPMSEVPRLEHWFSLNTHPAHSQIVRYTEELNSLPYRQKFPKLEPKNIQFWFKNRRAKFKRNLTLPASAPQLHSQQPSSSLNIERLIAH